VISYRPEGVPGSEVRGIFDDDDAKHRYFFPPSGIAHRKDVIDRIGPWRMPWELRLPVDAELQERAAKAGLRFVSTGEVTVHKFTSAYRYLSYVRPESDEQAATLARLGSEEHAAKVAAVVAEAKERGNYMPPAATVYLQFRPGEFAERIARQRGVRLPPLQALGQGVSLPQRTHPCAHDWKMRPILGIRRLALNPKPRLLVPVTGDGAARLMLPVVHPNLRALGPLELACNGVAGVAQPTGLRPSLWGWTALYEATVELLPDAPSILELRLSDRQRRKRRIGPFRLGFGVGTLRLEPVAF
jgi:hypothetical protein